MPQAAAGMQHPPQGVSANAFERLPKTGAGNAHSETPDTYFNHGDAEMEACVVLAVLGLNFCLISFALLGSCEGCAVASTANNGHTRTISWYQEVLVGASRVPLPVHAALTLSTSWLGFYQTGCPLRHDASVLCEWSRRFWWCWSCACCL